MINHHNSDSPVTQHAIVERVLELHQVELIAPQIGWNSKELSSRYGDWDKVNNQSEVDPAKVYVIPNYCTGSDYSGSLLEVSNMKALRESLPAEYEDGDQYIVYHGGHGTFAIAIRLDAVTEDLLETLEALEDYPLIDESLHSELEIESQNEAWESWAKDEFRTALGQALSAQYEASSASDQREGETDADYTARYDSAVDWLEDGAEISDDNLSSLFWKMAELANEYWCNEQGSDSYIDVDDVVKKSLNRKLDSDWTQKAYEEIKSLLQVSMGDDKYDLGIMRFIDPNQLSLSLESN